MNKIENLLTILAEECCETGQRATKALRFTLDEIQDGQKLTNAQRIVYEFNDIVAVMELLKERGFIEKVLDRKAINKKKKRVSQYLKHSIEVGAVK